MWQRKQCNGLTRIMAMQVQLRGTTGVQKARMLAIKRRKSNDTENIKIALKDGWVITFPQGTTKSFKPVRKGQHIIKSTIVVPIVIDGFRHLTKKGLRMKREFCNRLLLKSLLRLTMIMILMIS
jgi:hypothetical protein